MLSDKEIKIKFKLVAQKDPKRYYPFKALKELGFSRKKCKCGTSFWSTVDSRTCGDPACYGGFKFIGESPARKKLDYVSVWKEFSKILKKLGYTPIQRYPVVARWRDDEYWVGASIYDFQPHVVSGEVEPPANPLVVPQFCLRFNDIDNVGITGAHYTGFIMIGQHAFQPPEKYNQDQYLKDIYTWLKNGLCLPDHEVFFHEDVWAGGGNLGPCMEFFSRGLELGNQVYMVYEQTQKGLKELNLKVLDMGMGQERNAWFSKGTSTSYETTFPTVMKRLHSITGVSVDNELMKKFLPYSAYLNIDEIKNIDKVWKTVAAKVNLETNELKTNVLPLAALYSIAEHSRALLVAISDGALPSNIGGGYNLRVILRRALSLMDKYCWNIDLPSICKLHANYLKPLFPELNKNLDEVSKILDVEKSKYNATKQKSKQIVSQIIKQEITENKLLNLYDSQGISPDLIKEEAEALGRRIKIPEDFYAKVSLLHKKEKIKEEKLELNLKGVPETKALYYENYKKTEFNAKVIKLIKNFVILDKTIFYPTSGGQLNDAGFLDNNEVINVFKQGNVIVHELLKRPTFKKDGIIKGVIDINKRVQLTQHHTATHIVNAAAKNVLGRHVNQAGAKKTVEKAHLDITHFETISNDQLKKIEDYANKIIDEKIPVHSFFLLRDEAEKRYSMGIYQGGAVPGRVIRIVEIPEVDVEACGGTHIKNTSEIKTIKILKSTKIQDGVVRLEFVAGDAAKKEITSEKKLVEETAKVLGVKKEQVVSRAHELFEKWKIVRKAIKKHKEIKKEDLILSSTKKEKLTDEEILKKTAQIFKTPPEHILKTTERFLEDLKKFKAL